MIVEMVLANVSHYGEKVDSGIWDHLMGLLQFPAQTSPYMKAGKKAPSPPGTFRVRALN